MSQIHCVRKPSTINMTTDDPVIQEACRQSFHNHGQMVELLGKKYICMNYMGGGNEFVLREIFIASTAKPEVDQWNGEGLPPVGTVCEVQHPDKPDTWCKCTILVWDSECAVFSADANYPFAYDGNGYPESFRKIRTPEQIAAEEREKSIQQMIDDTNILTGIMSDRRIMAGQLYDAGYRKFEIVEGE